MSAAELPPGEAARVWAGLERADADPLVVDLSLRALAAAARRAPLTPRPAFGHAWADGAHGEHIASAALAPSAADAPGIQFETLGIRLMSAFDVATSSPHAPNSGGRRPRRWAVALVCGASKGRLDAQLAAEACMVWRRPMCQLKDRAS